MLTFQPITIHLQHVSQNTKLWYHWLNDLQKVFETKFSKVPSKIIWPQCVMLLLPSLFLWCNQLDHLVMAIWVVKFLGRDTKLDRNYEIIIFCVQRVLRSWGFQWCGFHFCEFSKNSPNGIFTKWRVGIIEIVCHLTYHVIGLKTLSLCGHTHLGKYFVDIWAIFWKNAHVKTAPRKSPGAMDSVYTKYDNFIVSL